LAHGADRRVLRDRGRNRVERLWTSRKRVLPVSVANHVSGLMQQDQIDVKQPEVQQARRSGARRRAAYRYAARDVLKEVVEDTGATSFTSSSVT
jgi:hypothetical protein